MDPKDALRQARINFDRYTRIRKIPGVTDTATRELPEDGTISAANVPDTLTSEVSKYPNRQYSPRLVRRGNKVLGKELPSSPVHDKLRATKGTLENAMSRVDAAGTLNPRDRETLKTFISNSGVSDAATQFAIRLASSGNVSAARTSNVGDRISKTTDAKPKGQDATKPSEFDSVMQSAGDWLNYAQAAFQKGAEMVRDGVVQTVRQTTEPLAKTVQTFLPEGVVGAMVDKEYVDSLPGDVRLNAKIGIETLKGLDPTGLPVFVDQMLQPKGAEDAVEGYKNILERVIAGDEEAIAQLSGTVISGIGGALSADSFIPRIKGGKGVRAAAPIVSAADAERAAFAGMDRKAPIGANLVPEGVAMPDVANKPIEVADPVPQTVAQPVTPSAPIVQVQRQAVPADDTLGGLRYNTKTVRNPRGDKVPVEFRVVEREVLTVSHSGMDFTLNPQYPKEMQPRDRTRITQQLKIKQNAQNLDPGLLIDDFNSTDRGAIVVGVDGIVESGNGRLMSIDRAKQMHPERYADYQQYLLENYPEATGMKDPVLVQVRQGDMDWETRIKMAERDNEGSSMEMTRAEKARAGIKAVPEDAASRLHLVGNIQESVNSRANKGVVTEWLGNLPPNMLNAVLDIDGKSLSPEGVDLFVDAFTAYAVGPEDGFKLLTTIMDDGDFGKRAWSALSKSLGEIGQMRQKEMGGHGLSGDFRRSLVEAMEYVRQAKEFGSISLWKKQGSIFGRDPIAMQMFEVITAPDAVSAFPSVVSEVANRLDMADGGFFGDEMAIPLSEIFNDAMASLEVRRAERRAASATEQDGLLPDNPPQSNDGGKMPPQAGAVDWKLLAAAGTASIGAAVVASPAFQQWWKDSSFTEKGVSAAVAAAAVASLYGIRKAGAGSGSAARFSIDSALLDPLALARKYAGSEEKVSKSFGQVLNQLTSARSEHVFESSRALGRINHAATKVFGKNWLDKKTFREWDIQVRDVMEANVAEGRPWHDGLPKEAIAFIEEVKPILDDLIDEWEAEGGKVIVRNQDDQHLKIDEMSQNGTVMLRLSSGAEVEYVGYDVVPPDPNDPFSVEQVVINAVDQEGSPVVIKPGQSFGRPIYRLGHSFVPRQFKPEFVKILKGLGDGERVKQAVGQYMAGVPIEMLKSRFPSMDVDVAIRLAEMLEDQNKWAGIRGDEMLAELVDMAVDVDGMGVSPNTFMASLERERGYQLAKFENNQGRNIDPYESSYIQSLTRYLDRGWLRVAIARQFGPTSHALGSAIRLIGSRNADYGRYLSQFIGRAMGIGNDAPAETIARAASRIDGAYQALTKLTGGTTVISQANDLVFAATEAGMLNIGKAAGELLRDTKKDLALDADALAGLRSQFVTDLMMDDPEIPANGIINQVKRSFGKGSENLREGNLSAASSDFVTGVMALLGIRGADRAVKRLAAVTLLRDVQSIMQRYQSTGNAKVKAEAFSELRKYGMESFAEMDPLALPDNRRAMAKLGQSIRRTYTYSGSVEDFPLWMASPGGSFMMRFKKPVYMTTRYLMERVMADLGAGRTETLVKFLTTSLGFGLASTYLKDVIRLAGLNDETREAAMKGDWSSFVWQFFKGAADRTVVNVLMDPERRQSLAEVMYAAGQQLYDSGSLGFIGDVTSLNRQNSDITGTTYPSWRLTAPLTMLEGEQWARALSQGYSKGERAREDLTAYDPELAKSLMDQEFSASALEQIGRSVLLARRAMDMLNLKSPVMQIRELERKARKKGGRTIEEDARYLQLMKDVYGRANYIRDEVDRANPKGESQLEKVSEAMGITQRGTPRN
jgi:hypothetical protein